MDDGADVFPQNVNFSFLTLRLLSSPLSTVVRSPHAQFCTNIRYELKESLLCAALWLCQEEMSLFGLVYLQDNPFNTGIILHWKRLKIIYIIWHIYPMIIIMCHIEII